jgi:hypothetical protein
VNQKRKVDQGVFALVLNNTKKREAKQAPGLGQVSRIKRRLGERTTDSTPQSQQNKSQSFYSTGK